MAARWTRPFGPRSRCAADALLNTGAQSPWTLALDASFAEYVAGDVETVTTGLDRLFDGDRGKLSARFIGTHDETALTCPVFRLAPPGVSRPRFDASASYVDAAETDTGHTTRVRVVGVAGNYILTDSAILHASVTNEARENSYDRVEFALGATAKF
ncbi:MAG: hypothetical protein WDM85_06040 [Caulobacteraceae bacterium]